MRLCFFFVTRLQKMNVLCRYNNALFVKLFIKQVCIKCDRVLQCTHYNTIIMTLEVYGPYTKYALQS